MKSDVTMPVLVVLSSTMPFAWTAGGDGCVPTDLDGEHDQSRGAGRVCGTDDAPACPAHLHCKEEHAGDMAAGMGGRCRAADWCTDAAMAASHCTALPDASQPAAWGCREHVCFPCPASTPPDPRRCPPGWQADTDEGGCLLFSCPEQPRAGEGETCGGRDAIRCQDSLNCHTTERHADAAGLCRDYSIRQGQACISDASCEAGTLCSNFNVNDPIVGTTYDPYAMCEPAWMLREFQDHTVSMVEAGTSRDSFIQVHGLASVGMNAIVDIAIGSGCDGPADDPTSPDGVRAPDVSTLPDDLTFRIIPGATGYDTSFRMATVDPRKVQRSGCSLAITDLPVAAPGDDSANVQWTLRVTNDNAYGAAVQLRGWRLRISSRWD